MPEQHEAPALSRAHEALGQHGAHNIVELTRLGRGNGAHEATRTQSSRGSEKYTGLRNIAELTRLVTIPGAHEALSSLRSSRDPITSSVHSFGAADRCSKRTAPTSENHRGTGVHVILVHQNTDFQFDTVLDPSRLSSAVLFSGPKPGRGPPLRSVLRIPNNSLASSGHTKLLYM